MTILKIPNISKMKVVGIIGGIALESTVDYYRSIIKAYREQKPDGSYPSIIINSIDMTKMLGFIGANQLTEVTEYLVGEVRKLALAGADFGLLASNTPHIVFDEVQSQSPIPLISIVEATCDTVKNLGIRKVGLFGTRFTMKEKFYPNVFDKAEIEVIVPNQDEQDYIHDKYMNELVNGIFLAETRERLLTIVDGMKEQFKIQGLILGGTELPLILRGVADKEIRFFDTTKIHVERVVARLLEDA